MLAYDRSHPAALCTRGLLCCLFALLSTAAALWSQEPTATGSGPSVIFQGDDGELFHVPPSFGPRAFLGVRTVDLTPELREHLGAPRDRGVLVSSVVDDGPAQRAGVEVGDIVTRVGDAAVDSTLALVHAISGHGGGEPTSVEAWRDGEVLQIDVVLEERDVPIFDVGPLVFRTRSGGPARLLTVGPGHLEELRIDTEGLDRLGKELGERIGSGDWTQRLELRLEDREALEGRIEELEGRLRELEAELRAILDDRK
ncbi:MAG: PDZ domain-containing protein [Thermoanaerobaculia bacterium]